MIREAVIKRMRSIEKHNDVIMRETGRLLSSLTGAASVVVSPNPQEETLRQLRFMPLRAGELLAVLLTSSGTVQNRIVAVSQEIDGDQLERIHNYLQPLIQGRNLIQVRDSLELQLQDDRGHYALLNQAAAALVDGALAQDSSRPSVVVEGQQLLFDRPEFSNAEKILAFLRNFEDRERLFELLEDTIAAGGVQVRIGEEAALDNVKDVSTSRLTSRM